MSHRAKVIAAFVPVYVIWGSTYLAIRVGGANMPSAVFAGVRFVLAGLVMLGALAALRRPLRPSRKDLLTLAGAGLLLLVGGNGLLVLAETVVPSGMAALVIATVPLWIAGLEAVLPGGERIAARGIVGILLGLLGLVILSWPELTHASQEMAQPVGLAVLLGAALSWSSGTLLMRRRPVKVDAFVATGWEMLFGGGLNLMLGLLIQGRQPITWNTALAGSLLYLIVFGSLLTLTAYVWLLKHIPAAKVATYAYVNPVIAVFLGWWLLGEKVTASLIGGMAVIVLAVVLVNTAPVKSAVLD
jgi:drug/metabolite transporter (DMT)-like permease